MLGGLSQPRDPLPECREVGWQPPKAVSMALPSTPQSWTVHREGRAARGLLQGQLLGSPWQMLLMPWGSPCQGGEHRLPWVSRAGLRVGWLPFSGKEDSHQAEPGLGVGFFPSLPSRMAEARAS